MNIGLIGYGYWGEKLARVIRASGEKLALVGDIDPSKGVDPLSVCQSKDVDAVVIATPPGTHFTLCREALNNRKHVLCEKPLTLDVPTTRMLGELAKERGLVLMTGYTYCYHAGIQKIKERLPEIGEICHINSIREGTATPRQDCDVIYDLAAHDVAIAQYLMGRKPNAVQACGRRDAARFAMRYWVHQWFTGAVSWVAPEKRREVYVVGANGTLSSNDATYDGPEPLAVEFQHFLDCIASGREPITGPAFSLAVAETLHEIYFAMLERGGERVLMSHQ